MDSVCIKQLTDFFERKYELFLEKSIIEKTFCSHKQEVLAHIESLNNIKIKDYIEYIKTQCKCQPVMAADVFQFSDFDDATINICRSICKVGNGGVKFIEVANLLLTDNVPRKDGALSKYGENHIKTAEAMGLAFRNDSKTYYLSAWGCVFAELSNDTQEKFLLRLIIRNKLITQLFIAANHGAFDLEAFLYDLSKSTYLRRRTNINRIIEWLNASQEYEFSILTRNIKY